MATTTQMPNVETPQITTTKKPMTLSVSFFGQSPDWWNAAMLVSLAVAAVAAFFVAAATTGAVVAARREAAAAEGALSRYKADATVKIAAARAAGDAAKAAAGKANEEAGKADERAENARLEQERLKQFVNWRTVSPENIKALESELAKNEGKVDFAYVSGDPESQYFALKTLGDAFVAVNKSAGKIKWNVFLRRWYREAMFFGVSIPGPENDTVRNLRRAFSAAHIEFSTDDLPVETSPVTAGAGLQWTPPAKHDAMILIGLKPPPL